MWLVRTASPVSYRDKSKRSNNNNNRRNRRKKAALLRLMLRNRESPKRLLNKNRSNSDRHSKEETIGHSARSHSKVNKINLNKMKSLFFASCLLVLFASCDSKRIYEKNTEIPGNTWDAAQKVKFEVNITDTVSGNNCYDQYPPCRIISLQQFVHVY
jgi:hypothetical protein